MRVTPEPPKTMLAVGTREVLEDALERLRVPAGVSASLTVKVVGPVAVSSSIAWLAISEMVGGSLTKVAVTTLSPSMVIVTGFAEPDRAPDHESKSYPMLALAVRVTT